MNPVNRVLIDGTVLSIAETRYSPAGVPITKLVLSHCSKQPEGDRLKQVQCQVTVQVIGSEHAPVLATLREGDAVSIQGFLLRNAYREDHAWLKVQALALTKISNQPATISSI